MSDPEKNDPENFLTRWSRRKRTAAEETEKPPRDQEEQRAPAAPSADRPADTEAARPAAMPSDAAAPAFDLSTLPPIESITADTDIRAFLAPGVPPDLRLAALRRAWVADPNVRNFVGLNDYDFDFHTPGAIAGFGPLDMTDDLRREVVRIVSAWQPDVEPTPSANATPAPDTAGPATEPADAAQQIGAAPRSVAATAGSDSAGGREHLTRDQDQLIAPQASEHGSKDDAASQQQHSRSENLQTLAKRSHGGALPQ